MHNKLNNNAGVSRRGIRGGWSPAKAILATAIFVMASLAPTLASAKLGPDLISHLFDVLFEDSPPGDAVPDGAKVIRLGTNRLAQYGSNYGSSLNPQGFTGAIYSLDQDLVLSVRGYDIDHNTEVGVYFGGTLIGYLLPTGNNQEGQTTYFTIPAGQFSSGYNLVEFRVEDGHDSTWGITDITLTRGGPTAEKSCFGFAGSYGVRME